MRTADIVICGAGIAGTAAAYQLAVRHRQQRVIIIDEREPMTLTSDKGTQGYRNWWPGPDATMLRFVSRSIDILEEMANECGNTFRLNRRGYVFVTARPEGVAELRKTAREVSAFGMGTLRELPGPAEYIPAPAEGYADLPVGADLLDAAAARAAFPFLTPDVAGALHVRRAGWLSAVPLGTWMLSRALGAGASFVRDRVVGVRTAGGRVAGVTLASGEEIATERVVIAAGPALPDFLGMLGIKLPVFHELHAKMTFHDTRATVSRDAPFMIWIDGMQLTWSEEERANHELREEGRRLLQPFPGGVHVRPVDGPHGNELYLIWTYDITPRAAVWPPVFDRNYGEVLLRGAARMVPAMSAYSRMGYRGRVDGGYYCKTRENRPLIGPLGAEGAYVLGALSGFGLMAAHAGAELVAGHVMQTPLPDYAKWFLPSRYDDPAYRAQVEQWGALTGQL